MFANVFFVLCDSHSVCSMCFCSQREDMEEEEESLFLSNNARICLHFVFLHIAKNEKFGLAKRTQRRMDVVF